GTSPSLPHTSTSPRMDTTDSGPPSARTTRMNTLGLGTLLPTLITTVPELSGLPQCEQTWAVSGFSVSQRGQKAMASRGVSSRGTARALGCSLLSLRGALPFVPGRRRGCLQVLPLLRSADRPGQRRGRHHRQADRQEVPGGVHAGRRRDGEGL